MKANMVKPGSKVRLADWDPNGTGDFNGNKEEALRETERLTKKLSSLQDVLYAEHKHKILIVLQAMDTAGKDGTIRHVFSGINPAGVRVSSFKAPSMEELDHDYLWRIHAMTPAKGEMVIFNRSHYEDVLVVRVHNLIAKEVWQARYEQINAFEEYLTANGTTILKFYLHIDKDEQKARLQARLDNPSKTWKFSSGDLEERKLWPAYMQAYEDVLEKTSTENALWTIVPANHKWYRNLLISQILVGALEGLNMKYPEPQGNLSGMVVE
jgi:PPK2 family polyphosphate:nucleotide phosphotransferase